MHRFTLKPDSYWAMVSCQLATPGCATKERTMRSFRDTAVLTLACTVIAVPTAAACVRGGGGHPPKPTTPCPTTPAPEPTSNATGGGKGPVQDSRKARHGGGKSWQGKQGRRYTHGGGTKPANCPPTTPQPTTPTTTTPVPTTPLPTTPVEPTTPDPDPTTPEEPTGPGDV